MSVGRATYIILGSPALYLTKFVVLTITGVFLWSIIPSVMGYIIAIVLVGFVLHVMFAGLHERLFGFRYGSWNDNASTERYVSGYEGRIKKGILQDTLVIKEKTTSEFEQGNLILFMFVVFDILVIGLGSKLVEEGFPGSLDWAWFGPPPLEVVFVEPEHELDLWMQSALWKINDMRPYSGFEDDASEDVKRLMSYGWAETIGDTDRPLVDREFVLTDAGRMAFIWSVKDAWTKNQIRERILAPAQLTREQEIISNISVN